MLYFAASKPRVKGGGAATLDPHLIKSAHSSLVTNVSEDVTNGETPCFLPRVNCSFGPNGETYLIIWLIFHCFCLCEGII